MADAVTNRVLENSDDFHIVHLTNISDGTGESAVVKVDRSALTNDAGVEPTSLDILSCRWAVQGFTSVRLLWDHTTDDVAMVLSGNGYEEFEPLAKTDPASAGGTGDILLTTAGAASGATYDITLKLRKR